MSDVTHWDVEPSSRNVGKGVVRGDGGGVQKATCNSYKVLKSLMVKIRLTMSSECYCKAQAEVCRLAVHQRLHESVHHEWTVHNTQRLFDRPRHQGRHWNSSNINTPLSLNTLWTCRHGIIFYSIVRIYTGIYLKLDFEIIRLLILTAFYSRFPCSYCVEEV